MNDSVVNKKNTLRKTFLDVRKSLSVKELELLSDKIISRLIGQSFFHRADIIHIYVSIDENREVITNQLIRYSLESGKQVVVPKMEPEGRLTSHLITSVANLKSNRWGVFEPVHENPVDSKDISLVITPMVAADFQKNRLGYGMGYYDRFLSETEAQRVGLCFNCSMSWIPLPTDKFDQSMDTIITESDIL